MLCEWSVQDNNIPGVQGTKKQRNGMLCFYPLVPGDPPRLVSGLSEAGGDSSHKGTEGTDEDSPLEGFAFAKCEHRFMENFGVLFPSHPMQKQVFATGVSVSPSRSLPAITGSRLYWRN